MAIIQANHSNDFIKIWKRMVSGSYSPLTTGDFPAQETILQQAYARLHAEEIKGLQSLVAKKIECIRHIDAEGLERVVTILDSGRTGSWLLASYLDSHDDIMLLPTNRSTRIYQFFECYRSLSLRDKLIAFPIFQTDLFEGDFPIDATNYYAAVSGIFDAYGDLPPEYLESSRAFFQFLHVVYCAALGRRPASRHPLIVYAQHGWNEQLAKRLVQDFPQARFIHTVRDPITNCGRLFDAWLPYCGLNSAAYVIRHITKSDRPHPGMESRTRTIRFEDLHLHLEKTMRALVDWVGLSYQPSLVNSTFNGVPWVIKRGNAVWASARPEQAIRDSKNSSLPDKGLLYALLNEDFIAWNYPCPDIFKNAIVRAFTCILVLAIPMKNEITAARAFIEELSSLRIGRLRYALKGFFQILICRVAIMSLVTIELFQRLAFGKKVLDTSWIKPFIDLS